MSIDDELCEVTSLLQEAGESAALAQEIRDSAEEELKLVEAQVADRFRNAPLGTTGKFPSETAVISKIPLAPEVQEKLQLLSVARLDATLWEKLMKALDQKAYSINTAARLIESGYISRDYIVQKRREEIRGAKVKV